MNATDHGRDAGSLHAAALAQVANGVVITDRHGTIEWVNPAFTRLSGYPAEEAVGRNPRLLKSGVQPPEVYQRLWATILAGDPWRGELVERHKDGHLYTVEQTITPMLDPDGQITHFVAVHEDVSRLRSSQQRLQALFDQTHDAILLADDDGRYVDVNPAASELTGYSREQLLTMGPADLAGPDRTPASVSAQFDEFLDAGTECGTFSVLHRSGRVIETEYRARAHILPGLHLAILRNVTQRNASIRALQASEARFRRLAEQASDIVAVVHVHDNLDVTVDYINPAASRLFAMDVPPGRIQRQWLHTRCHPDDTATLDRLLRITGAQSLRDTVRFRDAEGAWIWLEVAATVIATSETHRTVQLTARDATEQQRVRAALEAALSDQRQAAEVLQHLNDTKNRLVRNISHELRTPITIIAGFAELLSRPDLPTDPDATAEHRAAIRRSVDRINQILDNLAEADRSVNGPAPLRRQRTDLAQLVANAANRPGLRPHPISLDLDSVVAHVDRPKVRRILDHLFDNIERHTPTGTPVRIRLRALPQGAQLTIEDDGPGIPRDNHPHIFEPFQQGHTAAEGPRPGMGLGLTLVQTFAAAHGGTAWIDPHHTPGVRIHVTLHDPPPVASTPDAPITHTCRPEAAP